MSDDELQDRLDNVRYKAGAARARRVGAAPPDAEPPKAAPELVDHHGKTRLQRATGRGYRGLDWEALYRMAAAREAAEADLDDLDVEALRRGRLGDATASDAEEVAE